MKTKPINSIEDLEIGDKIIHNRMTGCKREIIDISSKFLISKGEIIIRLDKVIGNYLKVVSENDPWWETCEKYARIWVRNGEDGLWKGPVCFDEYIETEENPFVDTTRRCWVYAKPT